MKLLPFTTYLKILAEDNHETLHETFQSWYVYILVNNRAWGINVRQNDINIVQENDYVLLHGNRIPMATAKMSLQLTFVNDNTLNEMIYILNQLRLNAPLQKFRVCINGHNDANQEITIAVCEGCFMTSCDQGILDHFNNQRVILTISMDYFTVHNDIGLNNQIVERVLNYEHGEA
jgi:hypothetical protein